MPKDQKCRRVNPEEEEEEGATQRWALGFTKISLFSSWKKSQKRRGAFWKNMECMKKSKYVWWYISVVVVGLAYQEGKDIVLRFIIEYSSSLKGFWPLGNNNNNNNNNRSIYFYMMIFERWYFGLCWNLRISYNRVIIISWRILVFFKRIFFW